MKKDILFLCQFFYPEHNSSATLPFDTAGYLANHGKSVDAMCGYPKEYSTEKNILLRENKNGVNIRRLRYLQLSRVGKLGRLINYFSFTAAVFMHIPVFRKYKSVIVYSNPPILPIVPIIANILFKTQFVFVAYDIYPEVAYASHALSEKGAIAKIMQKINHYLYGRAAAVVALTDEMKQFILKNRPEIDEKRIEVIANWAHEKRSCPADEDAYKRFGYKKGQFIVTYFGNMGVCQDIETMLEAMKILKNDSRIQFLIVGHGSKKAQVEDRTKEYPNVKVLDFLTGEAFEQALAISACSIVSLENGLMGTCAPSKYYSYLQSSQPVLAVVDEKSYLAEEIEKEKIGCSVRVGEGKKLSDAILNLFTDESERHAMSVRARSLYEKKYEMSAAMDKYDRMFSRILES